MITPTDDQVEAAQNSEALAWVRNAARKLADSIDEFGPDIAHSESIDDLDDALGALIPERIATVPMPIYEAAVKGRQDFRDAFKNSRGIGEAQVVQMLKDRYDASGLSYDKFGESVSLSGEFVRNVLVGHRPPSKAIFELLGVERNITYRAALTAAFPLAPAGTVEVKPLEWGKTSYGTPEALTIIGSYRLNEGRNGGWCVDARGTPLYAADGRTNFPTIDDAKAGAQADFEARIRSALLPPQPSAALPGKDVGVEQLADLVRNAQALLDLDAKGVLVPHGIGGLAREIIAKFIAISALVSQPHPEGEALGSIAETGEFFAPDPSELKAMFDAMPDVPHGGIKTIEVYLHPAPHKAGNEGVIEAPKPNEGSAVARGMAIAAGILMSCWGDEVQAREILGAAGLTTVKAMRESGVDTYDIRLCLPVLRQFRDKRALLAKQEGGK